MRFFKGKTEQNDALLLLGPGKATRIKRSVYGSTSSDDEGRSSLGCDSDDYQTASLSGTSSGTCEMDVSERCRWSKAHPSWIRTTIVLTQEIHQSSRQELTLNYLESQYLENVNDEESLESDESDEDPTFLVVPHEVNELENFEVTTSETTAVTVSILTARQGK
jgi:hypothetical protein